MKTFLSICGISFLLSFTGFVLSQWKIIPANAKVKFFVKEGSGYEEGVFTGIKGDIDFDTAHLDKAVIAAIIDVKTINTGVDMRDESLRSKDFFETTKYPVLSFKSTSVTKTDTGFVAHGHLTIKKTSLPIQLPFTFTQGDTSAVFKGGFTIDRYQYGVGSKDDGVGNIVRIELQIPVRKK
jgi:polyisoprenoid-binding protein YceI